jgi:hypothetical protein
VHAQSPQVAEIVDAEIARGAVDRPSLREQVLGEQASVLTRDAEDESGSINETPRAGSLDPREGSDVGKAPIRLLVEARIGETAKPEFFANINQNTPPTHSANSSTITGPGMRLRKRSKDSSRRQGAPKPAAP